MFGLSQSEKNNTLYHAVDNGDVPAIKRAIAKGADPNFQTYNYGPVLFRAIGHYTDTTALSCVNALLESGASISLVNKNGSSALHYALGRGSAHIDVIRTLIDKGANVDAPDGSGATPLITALTQKGWAGADLLLDKIAPEPAGGPSRHALYFAVNGGASRKMLNKITGKLNIDVNLRYAGEKQSTLHAAVVGGRREIVQWMLERKGINVNIQNAKKETPLMLAVTTGRAEIVIALLEAGAQPDKPDAEGQLALTTAARNSSQEIAEALIGAKAKLDAADKYGMTALTIASQAGNIRLVKTLLTAAETAGEKLNLEPALFAAAEKGHGRVLELLISAGADVNAIDGDGRTPLMKAALSDQVETLSILVKAGAKPETADRHGMVAYDHAVSVAKMKAKDFLGRYRHQDVKTPEASGIAAPADDYHYARLNDHSLEVREGDSLTMTFNFWTQQVIFRDTERPAPVTVQNFADLQRQEAIEEAYQKLKELGGNPPDPSVSSMQKKMPGLGK
ncbi:MAG: ankyrin repeat domain-containing protein [Alphaproteobacteria bacterium]